MPYICLANNQIADGIVQITDILPLESQRRPTTDPPAQGRYVNRVQNDEAIVQADGTLSVDANGLSAYLMDNVEPRGLAGPALPWTGADAITISAALIARVDAGTGLTLANINTILATTIPNTELNAAGGSNSTGTVREILAIMAGQGYRLNRYLGTVANVINAGGVWVPGRRGSFTHDVLIAHQSEWSLVGSIGGDTVQQENKPVRLTVGGTSFLLSVAEGALATFAGVAGMPGVTLWPDSDQIPHFPWSMQGALTFQRTDNARVVTIYDDDGTVLA